MKGAALTVGGFYAHFSSKDELVEETLRRTCAALRDRLFARLDGSRKPTAPKSSSSGTSSRPFVGVGPQWYRPRRPPPASGTRACRRRGATAPHPHVESTLEDDFGAVGFRLLVEARRRDGRAARRTSGGGFPPPTRPWTRSARRNLRP